MGGGKIIDMNMIIIIILLGYFSAKALMVYLRLKIPLLSYIKQSKNSVRSLQTY